MPLRFLHSNITISCFARDTSQRLVEMEKENRNWNLEKAQDFFFFCSTFLFLFLRNMKRKRKVENPKQSYKLFAWNIMFFQNEIDPVGNQTFFSKSKILEKVVKQVQGDVSYRLCCSSLSSSPTPHVILKKQSEPTRNESCEPVLFRILKTA